MTKMTIPNQEPDELDLYLVAALIRAELRKPTHLGEAYTMSLIMTLRTVDRLAESGAKISVI